MSFFKKIGKFLKKFFFGYSKKDYENQINILQNRIKQLEAENNKLKEKLKKTEALLWECEGTLERLKKSGNKEFELHIYFSVQGRKRRTTSDFELIIEGIVPSDISQEMIINTFNQTGVIYEALLKADVNIGDATIVNNMIGGYTEQRTEKEPTANILGYVDLGDELKQYSFIISNPFYKPK